MTSLQKLSSQLLSWTHTHTCESLCVHSGLKVNHIVFIISHLYHSDKGKVIPHHYFHFFDYWRVKLLLQVFSGHLPLWLVCPWQFVIGTFVG